MGEDTSRGLHLADFVGHSIGTLSCCRHNKRLPLVAQERYADKHIVNVHIYFSEATDSPTERIAVSFEHKTLRLRF